MNHPLFAISGATGQTGSAVAHTLLRQGHAIRVLARNASKASEWIGRGAEVVQTDFDDADSLARGLAGATSAYFLNPPDYHSADMFASAQRVCDVWRQAIERSGLPSLVALSSVGSQLASGTGNIFTTHLLEKLLGQLSVDVHFVRAAWFMENWAGAAQAASENGVLPSFLSPLDRAIPMVSVADIGRVCAETLVAGYSAPRVTELHGPREYSPNDIAPVVAAVSGREVVSVAVPEAEWHTIFTSWGFSSHAAGTWQEMIQGFNTGHMTFESSNAISVYGTVTIEDAVRTMMRKPKS